MPWEIKVIQTGRKYSNGHSIREVTSNCFLSFCEHTRKLVEIVTYEGTTEVQHVPSSLLFSISSGTRGCLIPQCHFGSDAPRPCFIYMDLCRRVMFADETCSIRVHSI